MNNFKNPEKSKVCLFYHNYRLSTKNFDGNHLYELFLSNSHINKTQIQFPRPEIKVESKSGSRRSIRSGYKSQCKKYNEPENNNQKLTQICDVVNKMTEKKRQSTDFSHYKFQSQLLGNIQSNKQNNFFRTLYHSIQAKRKNAQGKPTFALPNYIQFNNKFKRPVSRRKQKEKVQGGDLVKPDFIQADPWIQGKLGGFSAQYISVLSNNKRVYQHQGDTIREIASLTKIMTCITALYLSQKFNIDINTQEVKVSKRASLLNGTTADLVTGDVLTLNDLLYAMMLPSGNDAAQSISDFFDKILKQKNSNPKQIQLPKKQSPEKPPPTPPPTFLAQMNKLSKHIKMKNTNFDNAHGLSNPNNYSTANDLVELCHYAMKNQKFREIVQCQEHQASVFGTRLKMKKVMKWVNTNKLLSLEHCQGIKTGVTPTAGPCMAASFQRDSFNVIIVILNAKNKAKRFQQVKNLYEWAQKQIRKNF